MNAEFRKELVGFLFAPISYIAAALYAVTCGLFVWVFKETSVLYEGYADLDIFFRIVPFIYIFLVPAVTMRLFAEERKTGTLELLLSKPIRVGHIVFGKFAASLLFIISINFFLVLYVFFVYQLGDPVGNVDMAAVAGACLGLILTSALFTAVGLFSSTLAKNQISAFLIGVFLCFILQFGLSSFARLSEGTAGKIASVWSIPEHYESMKKGILIAGDLLFFIVLTVLFLLSGTLRISGLRGKISSTKKIVYLTIILVICAQVTLPAFGIKFPWTSYKIDLTDDKRFSLSNSAKNFLRTLDKPVYAEIYLTGELPPAFERLEENVRETLQNLDGALPAGIRYKFIDPAASEDEAEREKLYASLIDRGVMPLNVVDEEGDRGIRKIIFPYLILRYGKQEAALPLLQGNRSAGAENMLNQSAEALEYELVSALKKISQHKKRK